MRECLVCGFEAKSAAGLSSHRRAKHPAELAAVASGGSIRGAVESAVPVAGVPGPLRELALRLAGTLDVTEAARDQASLARELRATLSEIAELSDSTKAEVSVVDELERRRRDRGAATSSGVGS